jgi:cytoskeletal protein RodZ
MTAFFSSVEGKIILGLAILVLILFGIGFWYFHYSQDQIQTLTSNNAKLQTSLSVDEKTIEAQTAFAKIQSTQISSLTQAEQTATSDATKTATAIITPNKIKTTTNITTLQTELNKESSDMVNNLEAVSK